MYQRDSFWGPHGESDFQQNDLGGGEFSGGQGRGSGATGYECVKSSLNTITKAFLTEGIQQKFEHDNIHLRPISGRFFLDGILGQAEGFFEDRFELTQQEDKDAGGYDLGL